MKKRNREWQSAGSKRKWLAPLAFLGFAFPGAAGLWLLSAFVLASGNGFETTDEALYLLVARDLTGANQWGFPAGWHTAPLYYLAGQDVANFRTLGAFLLGICGIVLGFVSYLVTKGVKLGAGHFNDPRNIVRATLFGLVGYAGTLFYYASLLRAPSYNWINLIGLLIAAIGFLLIFRDEGADDHLPWKATVGQTALVSFGLFYTFPGKPSSPFLFFAVAIVLLWLISGWRKAAKITLFVSALSTALIAVAVLTSFWPQDFMTYFIRGLRAPSLTDSSTVPIALMELVSLPISFFHIFWSNPVSITLCILAVTFATGAVSYRLRSSLFKLLFVVASWMLAGWEFGLKNLLPSGASQLGSWGRIETGVSLIVLYLSTLVLLGFLSREEGVSVKQHGATKVTLLGSLLLAWLPFVFGFGSTNPLIGIASHAATGFLLASMMLISLWRDKRFGLALEIALTIFAVTTALLTLVYSHTNPYRLEPIREQSIPLTLSDGGNSRLYVDAETAKFFQSTRDSLEEVGYTKETPIIGLQWRWNAALPYALGTDVLTSTMPTLFGYAGSIDRLRYNLEQGCGVFECERAWVAISNSDALDSSATAEIDSALSVLEEITGRKFPSSYEKILENDQLTIFRPNEVTNSLRIYD